MKFSKNYSFARTKTTHGSLARECEKLEGSGLFGDYFCFRTEEFRQHFFRQDLPDLLDLTRVIEIERGFFQVTFSLSVENSTTTFCLKIEKHIERCSAQLVTSSFIFRSTLRFGLGILEGSVWTYGERFCKFRVFDVVAFEFEANFHIVLSCSWRAGGIGPC